LLAPRPHPHPRATPTPGPFLRGLRQPDSGHLPDRRLRPGRGAP
jgi:hypothetical protein